MKVVSLSTKYLKKFITNEEIEGIKEETLKAYQTLISRSGAGAEFTGWIDYAKEIDNSLVTSIKECANEIKSNSKVLVVIGIGGSYLGSKAVISALSPYFNNNGLEFIFAGNNLSSSYIEEAKAYLKDKDFSINVISKSGTTTEPAVAFRIFKDLLIEKYGADYKNRIYAITDLKKGALRTESELQGYRTFAIPDDIGGRYSVITPVGLLAIACSGVDIDEFLMGIKDASTYYQNPDFASNEAMQYASMRNLLYRQGKMVEVLVSYEPKLSYLAEWWKQLYGESEGKDGAGLFPASVIYSTDLHSMGQFLQEGTRIMFETVVNIEMPNSDITINSDSNDYDGLNYLAGKSVNYIKNMATSATILAHVSGNVPNIYLNIKKLDAYTVAYLLYFFMFSCGISGYLLKINPFNQPGVEAYKKNMFALLEKPGYEELLEKLKKMK